MTTERYLYSDSVSRLLRPRSVTDGAAADRPSVLLFSTAANPSWEQLEHERLTARLLQSEKWRFETVSVGLSSGSRDHRMCFPAGLKAAAVLSRRLRQMIPRYRGLHLVACPYSPLILQLTLPLVLGRFYGVPSIVDLRFGVAEDAIMSPGRLTRKILKLARAVLVSSESPAVRLNRLGLPAVVAPIAIDSDRFRVKTVQKVQPRILVRLPASGPDDADLTALRVLLKAFELVKLKYPRTELRVLCDRTPRLIDQSDERRGVSIHCPAHDDDVIGAYQWADVFVNPAILSPALTAVAHALACGLPVVSTRGGGAAELIESEDSAIFIRTGQPGELAGSIIDLIEKPDLARRLSVAAADRGQALHSNTQASRWLRLYRTFLTV